MKKRNIFKFMIAIFVFMACIIPATQKVDAAVGMSVSTGSVAPGGSFTVTVSGLGNVRGQFNVSVSNGGGSTSFFANGQGSQSISVTAGSSGSVSVTVSAIDVTDIYTETSVNFTDRRSVAIVTPPSGGDSGGNSGGNYTPPANGGSSNTSNPSDEPNSDKDEETADLKLSDLSISKGKLSPTFSPDTYEYTATVGNDVEKITIEATAKDAEASVEGTGEKELKEGDNTFEIKVTKAGIAETMVYEITIHKEGKPAITLDGVNKDKLGILNSIESAPILKNFEDYTLNIKGVEVKAKRNSLNGIVVVYAIDENNEKNYYIFDEKKQKITSIYIPVALLGNEYAIVSVPKKLKAMEGYKFGKVTIDNQTFEGWSFKDKGFENYKLIYLMNEKGEKHLYQYEKTMNTLQLYSNAAPIMQNDYEALLKKSDTSTLFMYLFMGVSAALTIVVIGTLVFTIRLKKRR